MNFINLVKRNKSSIANMLEDMTKSVVTVDGVECLDYVTYILRKGFKISPLKRSQTAEKDL